MERWGFKQKHKLLTDDQWELQANIDSLLVTLMLLLNIRISDFFFSKQNFFNSCIPFLQIFTEQYF